MDIAARPDAHLAQLARIEQALKDDSFKEKGAKEIAELMLRPKLMQRLRLVAIAGMVTAGYLDEEIFLQMADPMSQYHILLRHMNQQVTSRLKSEIVAIRAAREVMGDRAYQEDYLRSRQRLLQSVWSAIELADANHKRPLIEIAENITNDIAENQGVIHKRAGRKSTQREKADEGMIQAETPLDTNPEGVKMDWGEEEFIADDEPDTKDTVEDRKSEESTAGV